MFSRTPSLCHASLRFQIHSASQHGKWGLLRVSSIPLSTRRWQSAVAIPIEDDEALIQTTVQPIHRTPNQPTDSVLQDDGKPRPDKEESPRKRVHFKRWRPHKAEELGVNVLGKPAEVLIIPARKSKSTPLAAEDGQSLQKAELQKSLDSEMKPVSMEEVLNNIESLKTDLGQGKQEFSAAAWKDFKYRLANGFTKLQLQEYLRIASGMRKSDPPENYLPPNNTKRNMAAKIMASVWEWRCRDAEDDQSTHTPELTVNVAVNSLKLDYVFLHEKQQLRNISENLNVQIDVFNKETSQIQITGDPAAVRDARVQVDRLVKEVRKSSVSLVVNTKDFLSNDTKAEYWLSTLMQKHRLFIQRNGDTLDIVGSVKVNPSVVSRDLLFLSGRLRQNVPFTIQMEQGEEQTTRVPVYPSDTPYWLQIDRDWRRHISSRVSAVADDVALKAGIREARRLAGNVLKSDKPNQEKLSRYKISPGSLSHDYTADLGQVLHNLDHSEQGADAVSPKSQSAAESVLVLQQGFLPQVLVRKEFSPVTTQNTLRPNAIGHVQPFLLHLRLSPATESEVYPRLELYLKGHDASLGLGQQLEIKSAFAILDEWQHSLLLPHQPVDILMARQSKIDLLGRSGAEPAKHYLAILQQLASGLVQTNPLGKPDLPPIWELDVSPLLNSKGNTASARDRGTKAEAAKVASKPASASHVTSTYVLEPPEILDVASYTSESAGDRFIDHVVYETDPVDKPRQRQVLRISRQSLSELLYDGVRKPNSETTSTIERQRWFKNSITAAYELAAMLSEAQKSGSQVGPSIEAAEPVT